MSGRREGESGAERWLRVEALFHAAAERPEAERQAFLRDACGSDAALLARVLAMLAADAQGNELLDGGVAPAAEAVLGTPSQAPAGQVFGPYRVTGLMGEGGMGVVYRARREDLASEAAIKVLRDASLSPARRARFAFEQRALAQLNHPAIARLYDADALPDGTPWIAMELVEGVPITEYCAAHGLSVAARLGLLRDTCEAVQHAHGQAILHRDLKPSNILVRSDGRVKLVDFGISKPLEALEEPASETRTGLRLMTPAYAAPEQVRGGPLGVHTDVYSLGVVLYELLAGTLPFDLAGRTPSEAATILTEQPVRRPSLVMRGQPGPRPGSASWSDLDVLCLTAMHRDPARRYRTVDALKRDIERCLANEPLEARGDSFRYVAGKFVRRHAIAVGASVAVLVLLAAVVAFYTLRLQASRDLARAEAFRAKGIEGFVEKLFKGYDDEAGPSDTLRVVTLLERGRVQARDLSADPLAQAGIERTLGSLFEERGDLDRADTLLSNAYVHVARSRQAPATDVASSLMALAMLRSAQERHGEAVTLARRGLELARRQLEPGDPLVAEATGTLGRVLEAKGDLDSAAAVLGEALRLSSAPGGVEAEHAAALTELANTWYYLGRYAESDSLNRLVLERDRRVSGNRHPNVATDLLNLGATQKQLGHYAAAEKYFREALDIARSYFGGDHPLTASCLTSLAGTLVFLDRDDEAAPLLREAVRIQEHNRGPWDTELAESFGALGGIALARNRYDEARDGFTRALGIYRHAYGAHNLSVGTTLGNLGHVQLQRGDNRGAEDYFRAALEAYRGALPPEHLDIAIMRIKLGRSLLRQRRYAEAERETRAGYDRLASQADPGISFLRAARRDLVADYGALGRPGDAARFAAELADSAARH